MQYKGEYQNGIKNGEGKEYKYNGKLVFEGEYKFGKRWNGEGEENYYEDYNGFFYKHLFSGEYLDGQRYNGEIRIYNEEHQLIHQLKILNGAKIENNMNDQNQ